MDTLLDIIPTSSLPTKWTLNDDQLCLYNKYTQNNNVSSTYIVDKINLKKSPDNTAMSKNVIEMVSDTKDVQIEPKLKTEYCKQDSLKKTKTVKKPTPSQIITELCGNSEINYDYIKNSLVNFISQKSFQTMFGIKKTSEVMKGLNENKWNKSFVTFVSFIFNKAFIYLKKEVSFYPATENTSLYTSPL